MLGEMWAEVEGIVAWSDRVIGLRSDRGTPSKAPESIKTQCDALGNVMRFCDVDMNPINGVFDVDGGVPWFMGERNKALLGREKMAREKDANRHFPIYLPTFTD
jgi:hypothetical protein